MARLILLFCILSTPFIKAAVTTDKKESNQTPEASEIESPPESPPADFLEILHQPPPGPENDDDHDYKYEHPSQLLTSEEIKRQFSGQQSQPETHDKTIDQIIRENNVDDDLDAGSVREGDVRVNRRKRSEAEDDIYDYDGSDGDAPEPPQLSEDEIGHMPPPAEKVGGRSHGDTVDQLFANMLKNKDKPLDQPLAASDVLLGRAAKRPAMQTDKVYDMDMLLTPEQAASLYGTSGSRKKRAAIKQTLWKHGIIPYSFLSGIFTNREKSQIYKAMNEWMDKTCLKFEPWTDALAQQLGHKNKIVLQQGSGCSSYVGMIQRGPQPVSLDRGCRIHSIILHELGHAIGLHHEQCRPDRDDHVTVIERNVYPSMLYNFDKYAENRIDYRGFKYDYNSIMHYGKTAFSKDQRSITINPRNSNFLDKIGTAQKLSDSDWGVVQAMYKGLCKGTITKPTEKPIEGCENRSKYCGYWEKQGHCTRTPIYMAKYCTKACDLCKGPPECKNTNDYCQAWANNGFCSGKYEAFMTKNCAKSCGKCGTAYKDMALLWGDNMPEDKVVVETGLSTESIVGIVVGCIAIIAAIAVVVVLIMKKRNLAQ